MNSALPLYTVDVRAYVMSTAMLLCLCLLIDSKSVQACQPYFELCVSSIGIDTDDCLIG